ncbi:MAG: LuxR family transcriptional regulator [Chloroflexi bacterium]|nr:LuxR family transcriptional regulator [Chloroflexota bacterium]
MPPLRLAEFAVALSLASDLGLGHPMEMVLASCLLSLRLGELLGLGDDELREVYYLALFRHAGCTADAPKAASFFGNDLAVSPGFLSNVDPTKPWTLLGFMWRNVLAEQPLVKRVTALPEVLPGFMQAILAHCEVAQLFAARLNLDQRLQQNLLVCNEAWNGSGIPGKLKGEAIPRTVRLLQVAEEAIYAHHFLNPKAVVETIRQRGGATLDPAIAERFCASAEHLIERSRLGSPTIREEVLAAEPGPRALLADSQLEAAAHADVGRVGVSSGIWCKPGPLAVTEWERVRLHPYYTQRILSQPQVLTEWGLIAASNRERLDGSGYHRNLPAAMLTPAMRILSAADVYQAMIETRPHRAAFTPEQAAAELKREVRAGGFDGDAVNAVLAAAGHATPEVRRQRVADLTEREIEVLRLVARGLSNRDIAQQLTVSPKTVGNHLQNIYSKIGVSTRAAATYFAMQHSLV